MAALVFFNPSADVFCVCIQLFCEVRGWSDVTEGRCFQPGFEDGCEDAGRISGKGEVSLRRLGLFFFTSRATIASSRYLRSGSGFGNGASIYNPLLRPQTLNVKLPPHLVKAALGF